MTTTTPNTAITTGKVRLSYCNIWRPRAAQEGQQPKYSCSILIPKTDKETITKVRAAIAAATEKGKPLWGGKVPPMLKTPLRDGDAERPDDPPYKGHWFLNASSSQAPGVVDRNRNEIFDHEEIYSGVYARVHLNFFPFNSNGNRGIGAGLNHIQKWADGPALSGRARVDEVFDVIEDDDDEFLS